MSEQNNNDSFTKFEEDIKNALSGDMKKNALDFVAFLKAGGMTHDVHTNVFSYMGKDVCCVTLDGDSHPCGPWTIYWGDFDIYEQDHFKIDEQLKEFVLANIHFCSTYKHNTAPHCNNSPGINRMIFDNQYKNVCTSSLQFRVPDAGALEKIKKLAELRKSNINVEIKKTK